MEENEMIDKSGVDNASGTLRSGLLNDKYLPKAQNVQLVGKYLKDKYYPGLSLDEINERIDLLAEKGLTPDKVVSQIESGKIDLATMSLEELKEIDENDGPSLD